MLIRNINIKSLFRAFYDYKNELYEKKDYASIEEKEERDKIEEVAVVNVTFQTGEN